ncbi:unnamed protein product [Strongylus vulgaris]|uniref:Uncharacterized protein n=1 Tax=Strongylus vulgaris TaxID=40348 RepID=A0A3P7KSW4_STRVU|nr:unnamed protein product [Strongylus vulgaris]
MSEPETRLPTPGRVPSGSASVGALPPLTLPPPRLDPLAGISSVHHSYASPSLATQVDFLCAYFYDAVAYTAIRYDVACIDAITPQSSDAFSTAEASNGFINWATTASRCASARYNAWTRPDTGTIFSYRHYCAFK